MFKGNKLLSYWVRKVVECFCLDLTATQTAGAVEAQSQDFRHLRAPGEVYTQTIHDCSAYTLRAVIRGRIDPESVVCSEGWPGSDGLVDVGSDKHLYISKRKSFTNGRAHINGIEAFWSFTKRRLAKFKGVKTNLDLHLKECEWRYNKSSSFLFKNLLTLIKNLSKLLV